jgi:hypothetical protein
MTQAAQKQEDFAEVVEQSIAIVGEITRRCPPAAPRGVVDTINCPRCTIGIIQFGREVARGRLRAACGTPMCFSLVE